MNRFTVFQSNNPKRFVSILLNETPKPNSAIVLNFAFDVMFEDIRTPLRFEIRPLPQDLFAEVGGRLQIKLPTSAQTGFGEPFLGWRRRFSCSLTLAERKCNVANQITHLETTHT